MPKIRTHKPTSKRFRASRGGKGKLMRTKAGKGHLRRKKSHRSKALFSEMLLVKNRGMRRRVQRLAPYLGKHT